MKILHQKNAEVASESIIISTVEDALNLMADLYYQNYDAIILHEATITPAFFDLKTGIAGEILQKFSNYRMRLAIVDDLKNTAAKALTILFLRVIKSTGKFFVSVEEAIERLG